MESSEQNKLTDKIKPEAWIHRTYRQLAKGKGAGNRKISAKGHTHVHPQPMDTDNSVVEGMGGWGWVEGEPKGGSGGHL